MDVILLEKIDNLGNMGDKVSVRPGYARNFLLSQNKAKPATAENIVEIEARRTELEQRAAEAIAIAEKRRDAIEALDDLTITAKGGTEGKLYGSIGPREIVAALGAAGVEVEKREIRMPEGAIRKAGQFKVELHLHTDINTHIGITIVAEE